MSDSKIATRNLLDLTGKTAIVTGASQGIGAAIALRLGEAGANIVIHYKSNKADAETICSDITKGGSKAIVYSAELSNQSGVQGLVDAAYSHFGQLDILINNAGIFPVKALLEISHEEWKAMYAANTESTFLCTKLAATRMQQNAKPSECVIINIASTSATSPAEAHSHYNSCKSAVLMFTRSAAKELGSFGIRVNAVSPGLTNRDGLEESWPEGVRSWTQQAPLGKLVEPSDIADACLFLASPSARSITGHNLIVDGGMMSANLY